MSIIKDLENLDQEVMELLQNYKHKMTTVYEPCNSKNFKECLIGLHEELNVLNINYIFNPYTDMNNNNLQPEALVNLINASWTLLQHHKNSIDKANSLQEQNHILEHTNKQLSAMVKGFKDKFKCEKNEARACVASAQRISDQSNSLHQKLLETRTKLNQVTKQKETNDKCLQNKVVKLQLENDKLLDRLRNKSDSFRPCTDVCDGTLTQLKERNNKQKAVIAQLQATNQKLLQELLSLKETLILTGVDELNFK